MEGDPEPLARYNNLHILSLGQNNLTSLPLGRYLVSIILPNNGLSGPFPEEFSQLLSLNTLALHDHFYTVGGLQKTGEGHLVREISGS